MDFKIQENEEFNYLKDAVLKCVESGGDPLNHFSLCQVEMALEAVGDGLFANILANTANKAMLKSYKLASSDWRKICTVGSRKDYKENKLLRIEEMSRLTKVTPKQATPMDFVGEASGTYRVDTYERGYQMNRVMMKNDDLNAFARLPQSQGNAAARTVDKFVFDFLKDNATCGVDSGILFSSSHSNIITSSPLSTTTLATAKSTMLNQTEAKTGDKLGLRAKYLIIPHSLEDLANRIVGSSLLQGTSNNDINTHRNMEVIVSPWLTDTGVASTCDWFIAASPMDIDLIRIDFLDGKSTPQTLKLKPNSDDGFDFYNRTYAFKTRIEFGGCIADYRGFVMGDAA